MMSILQILQIKKSLRTSKYLLTRLLGLFIASASLGEMGMTFDLLLGRLLRMFPIKLGSLSLIKICLGEEILLSSALLIMSTPLRKFCGCLIEVLLTLIY
jgi:hypothetical protein